MGGASEKMAESCLKFVVFGLWLPAKIPRLSFC
jgi:hypothetical protein